MQALVCKPKGLCSASNRISSRAKLATVRVHAAASVPTVTEKVEIGKSGVMVAPVGVGAWAWYLRELHSSPGSQQVLAVFGCRGDRSGYWGYNRDYAKADNESAYRACMENGLTFIDTAEVYGFGLSEDFLGEFMKSTGTRPAICTKFAPQPWRYTADSVVSACKASLGRLGLERCALYIQHWPGFFFNAFSNDAYLEGLARCKEQGLCEAVGSSNFNADRLRKSHAFLQSRGVVLSSNQVQYSLLYRTPEKNGVLDTCRELGITLVAYSPLAQGLLTGKYTADNLPGGPRGVVINSGRIQQVKPLLQLMKEIGELQGGKTQAQVAINWCICKGVIPIPGAKNAKQAQEIAGALGWRLTTDQVAALDDASSNIPAGTGAPFENW